MFRPPPPAVANRAPTGPSVRGTGAATGTAVVGPEAAIGAAPPAGAAAIEPDVQVVRFQGPPGLVVEVLAPAPVPVPIGDGGGIITVGLKRGVGYRLRIANIPERPGSELFPVIEIVGHLHRPEGVDPGKYPIRVVFNQDDLDDTVDRARLVTKVIYLEDPDQAIPFRMAKDQVPVLTLNPTEPPLRVATALGRPVAIVRIGGRRPTARGNPGRRCRRPRPRLGGEHRVGPLSVPGHRAARAARCRVDRCAHVAAACATLLAP